ncbi:MAG: molybdopterin molybdotransferase MoeA [Pseudomonadota bacterium]
MTGLMSVEDAIARLVQHALDLPVESVPLEHALGGRLAEPLIAKVSRPPAAVSAMDGYAVRRTDVSKPGAELSVIGEAPAGMPYSGRVEPGEAVRIFTGGVLPDGCDHIVIQEDAVRDGETLTCQNGYEQAEFVREAGRDFSAGDIVLPVGSVIGAAELALAAAANHAELPLFRRPRIGLLANGDELKPPGSALQDGEIINSNPIALAAMVTAWGGVPIDLGTASDSEASIRSHIETAESIDVFLPVGGASVGDHDHMRRAFASVGFEPVFEKIAVRPGKPTWFSKRGQQLVLGLPGNPASAFVCAQLFARILIMQADGLNTRPAQLGRAVKENGPREHFMRADVWLSEDGALTAMPAEDQDSSLIRPFLSARSLIRRRPNAPAAATGTPIELVLIAPL